MDIGSIQLSTIQERVYDELLKAILAGRIAPGEKLTIEGIAKSMGVSLMPIRIALQKLESENFITVGKNRRIAVRELSVDNLLELLQIRLLLECFAADKACKLRSEESLSELEVLNEKCNAAENADAYLLANWEFHRVIYSQANMPMLEEVISLLWKRASPYLHILLRNEDDVKAGHFSRNHSGMLSAMQRKNAKSMRYWLTRDLTAASTLVGNRIKKERIA
jgi:DNA-binding GntR family transcriptional regulator